MPELIPFRTLANSWCGCFLRAAIMAVAALPVLGIAAPPIVHIETVAYYSQQLSDR